MQKLRMVLCDHKKADRDFYTDLCRQLCDTYQIDAELKTYDNSKALLFDMGDPDFLGMVDMLFIETDMPELDGISFTKKVREMNFKGPIMLLTNSTDYYEAAFDVKASNYIRKGPEHLKRFVTVFLEAIEASKEMRAEYVILHCAGEYRQIAISNIKYFEVRDHIIEVYYKNEHFEFISTLGKIEAQLIGRGFQRVHRSYLVSLDYIHKKSYETITLLDGTVIPIGRTYAKSFKKAFDAWREG